MTPGHRASKANDIDDAPPTLGRYDESAIRRGARELIVAQLQAEIVNLKAENTRLLGCIAELERESCREPREFLRQRSIDDRHNSCEAGWNGRIDNRR